MNFFEKRTRQKANFVLLFNDSPEYFPVERARMVIEGPFVRFICFDEKDGYTKDIYYPVSKIHRIERYIIND